MRSFIVVVVGLFGCSASSPVDTPDSNTDSPPDGFVETDGGLDAADTADHTQMDGCNVLTASVMPASAIVLTPRPTGAGGVINDGIYDLTKVVTYAPDGGGSAADAYPSRIAISGPTLASDSNGLRGTYTFSTAANLMTRTQTCGGVSTDSFEYTATAVELHWFYDAPLVSYEFVFGP